MESLQGQEGKLDELAFSLLLGFEPFPYQLEFLLDKSNRIEFVAGRQVGKSTVTAIKALHAALTKPENTILVIAPVLRQSNIIFSKMREMLLKQTLFFNEVDRMTMTTIIFKNKSRVYCLPAGQTGETVRGFTANLVIVDEAAYLPEEVYVSIEPSLATTNGGLIFLGSPAGKIGRFWEAWNSQNFSKHHVPSSESPLISQQFLDEKRESMTEIQYRQEFMGEFVEEVDVFFNMSLIMRSAKILEESTKPEAGWDYFLGVDLARYGTDESAFVIARMNSETAEMVWYETTAKKALTDATGRVRALDAIWNFRAIHVDETGLGAGVVDALKEAFVLKPGKIIPVTFTSENRENLYTNLKYLMEKERLKILNDKKVIMQLASLRYEFTSGGHLRIIKDEKGNDDLVDGLALAVGSPRVRRPFKVD
jgi:hypothetical protein